MPAFREVRDVPLVVRRARRSREEMRTELGVAPDEKLLLFNFGGQDASWRLRDDFLPPGWRCVVCTILPLGGALPPRFMRPPSQDAYTPDILNACDAMLGKIGYGTTSECLAHGVPMVFVRRDYFNEEPFLRKLLEVNGASVEMPRRDFFAGRWEPYLNAALRLDVHYEGALDGAEVVATAAERVAAGEVEHAPVERATRVRLRDTIVFGYQLQRSHQKTFEVPEWYGDLYRRTARRWPGAGGDADGPGGAQRRPSLAPSDAEPTMDANFAVLDGDALAAGRPDVADFLRALAALASCDSQAGTPTGTDEAPRPSSPQRDLPEVRAARALFDWSRPLVVARAPGRLDVMGGIADYSGSLVLQMPIAQACCVAVQRQPVGLQRLWEHTRHRHAEIEGTGGGVAAVRVVSAGADAGGRAPTFDMDLHELRAEGGGVLSYARAREYFRADNSRSWAAYVVGCVVVLMAEMGVEFEDGLAILVHSEVPEGKGVSSSASVEVAAMSALAAAHGVALDRKELAVLCQKVENLVVGAPCGLMDQMASACGRDGELMRMLCQPDVLLEGAPVPPHVALWGIDSGIRHSVGGSDYGSVRVGAFMGRALINKRRAMLREKSRREAEAGGGAAAGGEERGLLEPLKYLTQLPVHEFEADYEAHLPESLTGAEFLALCPEGHGDEVTRVDRQARYAVRAPTAHPVREHLRVRSFAQALNAERDGSDEQLEVLGELMFQSHASYGACGLGAGGTDRLVELVKREAAAGCGLFGAKITGGGSGGTVCVLGRSGAAAEAALARVVERYGEETGHAPYVFSGSSEGADAFGTLMVRLRGNE